MTISELKRLCEVAIREGASPTSDVIIRVPSATHSDHFARLLPDESGSVMHANGTALVLSFNEGDYTRMLEG